MKQKLSGIGLAVVEIVVGLFLLISPDTLTKAVVIIAGIALLVLGVISLIGYFRAEPVGSVLGQGMTKGLMEIAIGAFILIKTGWVVGVFDTVIALAILLLGVSKLGMSIDLMRLKDDGWKPALLDAVVTLICAIIIVSISASDAIWMVIGISLIVQAVLDIVTAFLSGKKNGDVVVEEHED
ncbi:MAG: DUF308 domain-containing protein [Oscillospiraceae bacterium]|nr:DUF308 domain-containing protein [Oscillospiraceae bacterium]